MSFKDREYISYEEFYALLRRYKDHKVDGNPIFSIDYYSKDHLGFMLSFPSSPRIIIWKDSTFFRMKRLILVQHSKHSPRLVRI